jgi:hypothetical protein
MLRGTNLAYYNWDITKDRTELKINRLDQTKEYFTVCQHDDAPRESLPPKTKIFSAGGNVIRDGIIPIPLVCSAIPNVDKTKTRNVFCSFVGSVTHPLRQQMIESLQNKKEYIFQYGNWKPAVSLDNYQTFKTLLKTYATL